MSCKIDSGLMIATILFWGGCTFTLFAGFPDSDIVISTSMLCSIMCLCSSRIVGAIERTKS